MNNSNIWEPDTIFLNVCKFWLVFQLCGTGPRTDLFPSCQQSAEFRMFTPCLSLSMRKWLLEWGPPQTLGMVTNRPLNVFRSCLLPSVIDSSQTTGSVSSYVMELQTHSDSQVYHCLQVSILWLVFRRYDFQGYNIVAFDCFRHSNFVEKQNTSSKFQSHQKHLKTSTIAMKSWLKSTLVLHLWSAPLLQ